MKIYDLKIKGHLDVIITNNQGELEDKVEKWQDVLIHGDTEGLRSFGELLIKMADLDQNSLAALPVGAREHIHLQPDFDLSKSSVQVIVGRLDAKGNGDFYDSYVERTKQ
jgi:hypothetical protein